MRILRLFLSAISAASCASIILAQAPPAAQTPSVSTPTPTRPNPPALGQPGRPVQRYDRGMQDLTEDQRKKVEEANKAYSEKAMPVFGRLTTARRELEALVNADKIDEAAIRAKAKDIADAEADLAIARGQRHAKLREFLSPEQARRFSQPTPIARPFQPALHDGQPPAPIAPAK